MKPYNNDEFSNYLVESTSQFFDRYGKMYGENLNEVSKETALSAHAKRATYDFESDGENPKDYTKSGKSKADNTRRQIVKKFGKSAGREADRAAERGIYGHNRYSDAREKAKKAKNESFDIYSIVLEYILEGGYANSLHEAFNVMSELDEEIINDILDESSAGYTSREYAVRREKDISRLKGKVGAYKKGAGPQNKAKDAMVSDIRAMRAQRKVSGDKLSGKEAENRKIQRLAQAKRMADKRRESEAASKKKGLASRAKSAIKKMFNKEDFDIYDVVLQYILDEGYAVSFQEAFGIMSELDEDTILDILEETGFEYIED